MKNLEDPQKEFLKEFQKHFLEKPQNKFLVKSQKKKTLESSQKKKLEAIKVFGEVTEKIPWTDDGIPEKNYLKNF